MLKVMAEMNRDRRRSLGVTIVAIAVALVWLAKNRT
ncbi:MAG: hypothetical protein JKX71_02640 [Amylibacter sp.]|nr:hypothetical protein [Amylibacter sp.]